MEVLTVASCRKTRAACGYAAHGAISLGRKFLFCYPSWELMEKAASHFHKRFPDIPSHMVVTPRRSNRDELELSLNAHDPWKKTTPILAHFRNTDPGGEVCFTIQQNFAQIYESLHRKKEWDIIWEERAACGSMCRRLTDGVYTTRIPDLLFRAGFASVTVMGSHSSLRAMKCKWPSVHFQEHLDLTDTTYLFV